MTFAFKKHIFIFSAVFLTVLSVTGIFYHKIALAFHAPQIINFAPTTLTTDDVAGKTDASYDILYSPLVSSSTVDILTVTFPSEYTITDGSLDPSTAINSSDQGGICASNPGFICVSDDDASYSVLSMVGDNTAKTITITIDPVTIVGAHNPNFAFSVLQGIQNPTTAGVEAKTGFIISNNGTNSGTLTRLSSDVTIIAGPADHLVFTQQPSGPSSNSQDSISGTDFDVQPIVEAQDQYGNLDTNYTSWVGLTVSTGAGSVSTNSPGPTPGCISATSVNLQAVGGIADFSDEPIFYSAFTDHESFSFSAVGFCSGVLPEIVSNTLTSDVVVDTLVWTQSPDGCISGEACTTQGIIEAQGPGNGGGKGGGEVADIDFTGDITFGSAESGTIFGTNPQSMIAGILNTIGLGYNNSNPLVDEIIEFTADSGSLIQGLSSSISIAATPPTVTLTSNSGLVTQTPLISVTATFSEDVTGFTLGDISVQRGTAQNFNAASGTVYTFDIVPTEFGNVRINISADVAENASPNGNLAADQLTVAYQKGGSTAGGDYNPNTNEIPNHVSLIPPINGQTVQVPSVPTSLSNLECAPYLTGFLKKGAQGNSVVKLQAFFRKQKLFTYPTDTGFFGSITEAAVKTFQQKYASEILTPQNLSAPTGLVMSYTLKKINGFCGE